MFFRGMISMFILTFSMVTFASNLSNCVYHTTQVLKINGGGGSSCVQSKLCYAEILCTKKLSSGKEIDVSRNIVCALDSTEHCPAVETCRNDKTTATFEKEAQVGSAGKRDWTAIATRVGTALTLLHLNQRNGQPLDPEIEKQLKEIDESKEKEGVR